MTFKRPEPLMFAQPMAFQLDHLYFAFTRPEAESRRRDAFYNPLGRPMLFDFVIPEFQRDLVWTEDQKRALIHSVWLNIPIGTYSVNFSLAHKALPPKLRNILIDGQQRLDALRGYWSDEFDYDGYYWSQLSDLDQRYFVRTSFPQMRTDGRDEAEVRRYYNAMNFAGTAHKEEERA